MPTPIWISRHTIGALAVAGAGALVLLCWRAPVLVTLGIGGGALAIVLSLPVRELSRLMPRGAAIALSMLLAAALALLAVTLVAPIVLDQLRELVAEAPAFAQRIDAQVSVALARLSTRGILPGSPEQVLGEAQQPLLLALQDGIGRLVGGLARVVSGAAGVVATLLGMVVVAAQLLADARRIHAAVLRASPHRYRRDVGALWAACSQTLSRYLSGLLLSMVTEGALAAIAFHLLGVPYAILLGAWVAATAVIPYVGAWVGYAPALLLALHISPSRALLALVVCVLINTLESNVLSPRIQGQAVHVHPGMVFAAVIAGGELFGVPGIVLAVPTVALLHVLFDFLLARVRVEEETAPARERRVDGQRDAGVIPRGAGVTGSHGARRVPLDADRSIP